MRKNFFACLFSVHHTISLSRHKQVCLTRQHFERYFSHHSRNISQYILIKHTCSWRDKLIVLFLHFFMQTPYLENLSQVSGQNRLVQSDPRILWSLISSKGKHGYIWLFSWELKQGKQASDVTIFDWMFTGKPSQDQTSPGLLWVSLVVLLGKIKK